MVAKLVGAAVLVVVLLVGAFKLYKRYLNTDSQGNDFM